MDIRSAVLADAGPLAELAARTFRETFAADNTPEDMAAHEAESYGPALQGREITDPAIVTLLVHVNDELVAFAQVRRGHAPDCVSDRSAVELWRFYVSKEWHGRGIAQSLMRRVDDAAVRFGAQTLWLGVWERNGRAQAFYRKSGYTDVGAHVYMVGADAQTDRIMTRPLA